jgi:hypothetical protein
MSVKLETGDRIRIIIEGTYNEHDLPHVQETGTYEGRERGWETMSTIKDTVTVELVERPEPPEEVFKPGDVVADREFPSWKYVVGKTGYTQLSDGTFWSWDPGIGPDYFTSKLFERVDLG